MYLALLSAIFAWSRGVSLLFLQKCIIGGSIEIIGETTDVDTSIAVTGQDNTSSSVTYHSYLDASAESWTPDEHIGRYIVVTAGTGSGSTLYPIIANTAHNYLLEFLKLAQVRVSNLISYTEGNNPNYNSEKDNEILQRLQENENKNQAEYERIYKFFNAEAEKLRLKKPFENY